MARAKARLGLTADAPVRSCYEAGRDGFWPHRFLTTRGVTNLVVDSSSIEVPRRARRTKTDRLDGEKLLRLLLRHWGGEREMWHVVHVPTRAVEDARHASRGLTTLQAERTRYRNRIHSLLALHGVGRLRLDAQFPDRLIAVRDWAGAPLPAGVQARLLETWELWHMWRRRGSGRGDSNGSRCARPRRRRARQRSAWRACAGSRRGVRRCSLTNSSVVGCAIGEKWARSRAWSRRRIGVARSLGPGRGAERAAGGAAHRRGNRVGVAAVSTDECARAVVSPPVWGRRGGDAPHWDCGVSPARDYRAVALRRNGGRP